MPCPERMPMKKYLEQLKNGHMLPLLVILLLVLGGLMLLPGNSSSAAMTGEEMRISRTLSSIQGAGETSITLYYAASSYGSEQPVGAVIVSQGAADMAVRLRLIQAAQTLLGLESDAVAVFEREELP